MQHNTVRLTVCGILLVMAACAPQPTPTLTLPPPTSTVPPPTNTPSATMSASTETAISTIDAWLTQTGFNGSVLIARNGNVLLSRGYGLADVERKIANTPQTQFRIGSFTEQFTAVAILILQDQGKLDVKQPICKYLDNCPSAWAPITIEQVMDHSSGIPDFTGLSDWAGRRPTPWAPTQTIDRVRDMPLALQPGTGFNWAVTNYVILGTIIERVSGQSYEEFLQQTIFTPLNLNSTRLEHGLKDIAVPYAKLVPPKMVDSIDVVNVFAEASLVSTVEDIYRWEQALHTDQLLPLTQLDQMFVPRVTFQSSPGVDVSFGYGIIMGETLGRPDQWIWCWMEGARGMLDYYPADQTAIIFLSNTEETDNGAVQNAITTMFFQSK